MARSKLELYVDILDALVAYGPLKVTWIILKARVNYAQLKPILSRMLISGLVEEETLKDGSVVFDATNKGRTCFVEYERFGKLNPTAENAKRSYDHVVARSG